MKNENNKKIADKVKRVLARQWSKGDISIEEYFAGCSFVENLEKDCNKIQINLKDVAKYYFKIKG